MDSHWRALERMYVDAPVNRFFRPAIQVREGAAEIRMGVRRDMHHAAGSAHGAVYFKMLDDASFFSVQSLVTEAFSTRASATARKPNFSSASSAEKRELQHQEQGITG